MNKGLFAIVALIVFASSGSMADVLNGGTSVNANGTLYQDYFGGGSTPLSAIPGMNTTAWDPTTGLGTFTYTDNGTGARFFDVSINLDLGTAFWNEYAVFQGVLAPGQSAQADTPDFSCDANRCGNIIANTNSNALDGQNHLPGQLDNYFLDCGANAGGAANPACNNDVALALGFAYTIPAGDQAVLNFTISQTPPSGGFYIAQIKPQDGDNDPETVYFSGNVAIQPVPEPATMTLMAVGSALALLHRKRKR